MFSLKVLPISQTICGEAGANAQRNTVSKKSAVTMDPVMKRGSKPRVAGYMCRDRK